MEKICSKCLENKDLLEFHKNNQGKFGVRSVCKICQNKITSKWAKDNPDKQKERCINWKRDNQQRLKNWVKIYNFERNQSKNYDDILYTKSLLNNLKSRAKKRNLDYNLDFEYLINLIKPMICQKTGIKLVRSIGGRLEKGNKPNLLSIDRIDSNLGYIKGNIQIVCWWYNVSKQNWTEEEVLFYAKKLIKYEKNKK